MKPIYTVVRADDLADFIGRVDALVEAGYKPAGGVVIIEGSLYELRYFQALYHPGTIEAVPSGEVAFLTGKMYRGDKHGNPIP